jgi:hypothetical protein
MEPRTVNVVDDAESVDLTLDEIRTTWIVLRFAEGELRSTTRKAASKDTLPIVTATLRKLETAWQRRTHAELTIGE